MPSHHTPNEEQAVTVTIDQAMGAIQRDYYKDVNNQADDFIERIKAGEFDDREHFFDTLNEDLDGAGRVIYTFKARLGLLASDNEDVGIDELGTEGFDWSGGIPYSALMFFAFRADVIERIEQRDIDLDDDDTFEWDDDDDDDED